MIRRWSYINQWNSFSAPFRVLTARFRVLKLRKAINFRKFVDNVTKFKRRKLSSWKRKQNWLIYTQVIKYWIRDYSFNKKTVKSQFIEMSQRFNMFSHDHNFIKKKTPLLETDVCGGVLNFLPKIFFLYYKNKFQSNNSLKLLIFFKNSNFTLFNFFNFSSIIENQSIVPIFFNAESNFYAFNDDAFVIKNKSYFYLKNLNFFFKTTFYFNLYSYRIFLFFIFIKR